MQLGISLISKLPTHKCFEAGLSEIGKAFRKWNILIEAQGPNDLLNHSSKMVTTILLTLLLGFIIGKYRLRTRMVLDLNSHKPPFKWVLESAMKRAIFMLQQPSIQDHYVQMLLEAKGADGFASIFWHFVYLVSVRFCCYFMLPKIVLQSTPVGVLAWHVRSQPGYYVFGPEGVLFFIDLFPNCRLCLILAGFELG